MWKTPWLAIRPGHVRFASGAGHVRFVSGSERVRCASGSGCVRFASGAGHFRFASGSERVRCASGAGCVRFASGAGHFRFASGSERVRFTSGSGCVRFASGTEYVRSAVWADCLRFAGRGRTAGLFSPASARLAAPLGLLGCAGAGRRPRPRRNGARLPPPSSAPAVARCGAGAVVAFGGLDCHFAAVLFLGSLRREGVDPRHAGIGCRCARRMRRLPAALAAFARRG